MKVNLWILPLVWMSLYACHQTSSNHQHTHPSIKNTELDSNRVLKRIYSAAGKFLETEGCYGGMTLYNEVGEKLHAQDYSDCGELFKTEYFTYTNGKITQSEIKSAIENVTYSWIYSQDNRLLKKQATQTTSSFPFVTNYIYDSLGQVIESRSMMADDSYFNGTCIKTFKYNSKGQKIETQCYNGINCSEKMYRIVHLYNEAGLEIGGRNYKDPTSDAYEEGITWYEYY